MISARHLLLGGLLPAIGAATAGTGLLPQFHLSEGYAASIGNAQPSPQSFISAKIERLDSALDDIVPSDTKVESVASGFKWTEGPIWTHEGFLLFAEIPSNSILKLSGSGKVDVFMKPSGYAGSAPYGGPEPGSNGMTLDRRGRLTAAGHAGRNVWRLETLDPHATKTILADTYEGKSLNSPNDLVYRSDGSLYFTDPPYGLRTQGEDDPQKQLSFTGVFRIIDAANQAPGTAPNRSHLQLLIKDLPRPNGIAFSPDEKYLYVANTGPRKVWMRYPVNNDGSLGAGQIFFDATSDTRPGAPDGIKVDQEGNIYGTGPGGIWIFSASGKHLGTIPLPGSAGNLNWGDADGKTLYITESDNVLRIRLKIRGLRP